MSESFPGGAPHPGLRRAIGLGDLVLFNIAVVCGIRWFSNAAHAGPGTLALWLLGVLIFFVPSTIMIAGLSRRFPEEGGFYIWIRNAFGEWHAYLSAWLYSLGVLFLFPSLLLAGVSIGVLIFGPDNAHWADNPGLVLPITLVTLWTVTLLNIRGIDLAKWISNFGGASTYIAFGLLLASACVAWSRNGPATQFHFWPHWDFDTVNFWAQLAYALTGLEMAAIIAGEIRDPDRTVPRAAAISAVGIVAFYIAGTAAVLILLRPDQVNVMNGLVQASGVAGGAIHAPWLMTVMALLVTIGVAGQFGALLTANSRLPYVVGLDRYLPPAFALLHPRFKTPYVAILTQAILSTIFLAVMQSGETLRAAYQILLDMAILANAIPFLYLFAAGWKFGYRISGALGFLVSLTSFFFSAVPVSDVTSVWSFELKLFGGLALLIVAGRVFFVKGRSLIA